MKKLYAYIKPHMPVMLVGLLLKLIAAMLDLMLPFLLERIIDDIAPTRSIRGVLLYGGIMLLCALASSIINLKANRMATINTAKITLRLRHDLFVKISALSPQQTDKFTLPTLISRLTSDSYYVNDMILKAQRIGLRAPMLLIGGVIIALTLDPVLTLVLISMTPIIACVVWLVTKYSVPVYTKCQGILDRLISVVQENASGVRVVKALSTTEHERKRFDAINARHNEAERKANAIMAITNPAAMLVLNIGLTLVVLAGAYRVNSGLTQTGAIIAFLSYFTIILNAMLGITRIFIVCSRGAASANRISEILDEEEGLAVIKDQSQLSNAVDSPYHIEFENVEFSYGKVEPDLTNVSFRLKRGETLGIIGSTGSGKSTLINLLIRFYDPDKGVVRINGLDVRGIDKEKLCEKYGIAFQSDFIMASSIRDNVDYGREISDFDFARALNISQSENMVAGFNDGAEHRLTSRGSNLSGGQRQRLFIARAVAARPEILILDDSSSALDYGTDAALRRAIATSLPDTTKVIVAQRVSSVMHADLILALDGGKVIGIGNHDKLITECDEYRNIAETQMGGDE